MEEAFCPHCHNVLKRVPKRKSKCPHCEEFIYIRTKQDLFPRHLLTNQESLIVDQMHKLEWLGVQYTDYFEMRDRLRIKIKAEPRPYDILLGVYNKHLIDAMRGGDHYRMKVIYYSQALFLSEIGIDFSVPLELTHKVQLIYYQRKGYNKVRVIGSVACQVCQETVGKEFMVSDIIDEPPLPCKGCETILFEGSTGFCRCRFVPVR